MKYQIKGTIVACLSVFLFIASNAQNKKSTPFKIIAFYTAKNDLAHIDFVKEAHQWFRKQGEKYNFRYDSTSNWSNLKSVFSLSI